MQSDKTTHQFKEHSKFEDVVSLYNFDRELRILLFDIIERIEIMAMGQIIINSIYCYLENITHWVSYILCFPVPYYQPPHSLSKAFKILSGTSPAQVLR